MTTTTRSTTTDLPPAAPAPGPALAVLALTTVLSLLALLGPSLVASDAGMMMTMGMTHYMELLAVNQPRNLIVFMAIPVILAETLAITELVLLFARDAAPTWVRTTSRVAGLVAGPVMFAILLHLLLNAVVPLTVGGGWRGAADVIAVLFYLSGAIPLVGITLLELGVFRLTANQTLKWHAACIAVFLVVAHVAMIFGMIDPAVFGYRMQH